MFRSRIHSSIGLAMVMFLLCATSLVQALDGTSKTKRGEDLLAEAMIIDGFFMRPGGMVATVAGSITYVLTLPFSIPSRSANLAARKLVVEPAQYTFTRPLGWVDHPWPPRR